MPYPNRQEALASLQFNRNTAIVSLAAIHLINSNAVLDLKGMSAHCAIDELSFNPGTGRSTESKFEIDLGQICWTYVNDREALIENLRQFWKSTRRNLIKESFEIAKAYAEANDCSPRLNSQPWYQFARIIRNSLSHDFHLHFGKQDLQQLPVSWRDKWITLAMNGSSAPSDLLDPLTTWLLFEHIYKFVEEAERSVT